MTADLKRVHEYVRIEDERLTQNFWLYEFLASETAQLRGIDNTPNEEQLEAIQDLAIRLQSLRDALPVEFGERIQVLINSGFRSDELNAAVGGSKTSDHLTGLAADPRFRRTTTGGLVDPVRVAKFVVRRGKQFDQIILYPGQTRFHIGFGSRMRREIKHKVRGGYAHGFPA